MNVVSLFAENVKRIKAIRISPKDPTVIVAGNNGEGKSTILDCIQMALGGKDAVPDEPIRRGASSGRIILETDDLIVTRKFSGKGGTSIEVSNKSGLKYPSPQAVLDALTSTIGFDPLAFSQMKDRDQAQALRDLVGLDTTQIDAERKEAFEERTAVNRQIKQQRAVVDSLPATGPAAVDVSDLISRVEKIREENRKREEKNRLLDKYRREIEHCQDKVTRLRAELELAEMALSGARVNYERAGESIGEIGEELDTTDLMRQIASATETNKLADKVAQRKKEAFTLETLEKQASDLTAKVEELDAKRHELITGAKFPVSGLGFSDAGVTFNGVPFSQASRSEQIRVGMAIAIASDPKFRVVLIRDGSLLDDDAMRIVSDMAAANGFQVWIERVGTEGQCTVLIEDGEAVEVEALAS